MSDSAGTPEPRYGKIDEQYGMRLATAPDDDGPIWMLNLMKYRDRADYADGRETNLTGREADDVYAPVDELAAVGAEIVYVGEVDTQLVGDPIWDRVAIVKYPTRQSFIALQSVPGFSQAHVHKEAGMEQTIVSGCVPEPTTHGDDAVADWADVPFPPTEADGPVQVLNVLRWNEPVEEAQAQMAEWARHGLTAATKEGVRVATWLAIEGTIIGDGRSWDTARFSTFPSHDAFTSVLFDRERLASHHLREAAIADSFVLVLRPFLDRLAESIEETS